MSQNRRLNGNFGRRVSPSPGRPPLTDGQQAAVTYWMTELELELEIQDVMSDESP